MHLRVFEAFAGYGSQHMALDALSADYSDFTFEVVGIAEIDKYAIKAYEAAHLAPAAINFGDISKINWGGQEVPDFDLFTYSFPCQDISTAGKQRGFSEGSGTRSSLLWECEKAIRIKRPKYLLMENVKALTQRKHMADFQRWQDLLTEMGYTNHWQVLNAKHYGVPQNRERVFMVSFLNAYDCNEFHFPGTFPLERRLKDILEKEVDERYYLRRKQIKATIEHCRRKVAEGCGFKTNFQTPHGISGAIKTKEGSREYDTYIVETIATADVEKDEQIRLLLQEPVGTCEDGTAFALTTKCGNVGATNLTGGSHYPMTGVIEVCAVNPMPDSDGSCRTLKSTYSKLGASDMRRDKGAFAATGVIAVGEISESRLRQMFEAGRIDPDKILFIDSYNGLTYDDVAGTITTRVDRSNHTWVSIPVEPAEAAEIIQVGNYLGEKKYNNPTEGRVYSPEGIAPAVCAHSGGNLETKIVEQGMVSVPPQELWIKFVRVRKLTPTECFRLMGVPQLFIDRMIGAGISNAQLYKLAGNSIVVDVLVHIFKSMFIEYDDKPRVDAKGQYLLF